MSIDKLLNAIKASLVFYVLGGALLFFSFSDMIISLQPAKTFEDLLDTNVKAGDHISGDILYSYDSFASEERWTENKDGSRTPAKTSSYYYAIPANETILAVQIPAQMNSDMEELVNETYNYLVDGVEPTKTISFEGRVSKMEDELVKYFHEFLLESEFTQEEIDAMGEPLVIEKRVFATVRIMFIIGFVLIIVAFLWTIRSYKRQS